MNFYHYSKEQHTELKSLSAQQGAAPKTIISYSNSISLFMEPLPLNVADIFRNEHNLYRSGLELYEHVIDSNNLPLNIDWHIVESPEKVELLYKKQDWENATEEMMKAYKDEISAMEINEGYIGSGRLALVKKLRSRFFSGKTMEDYFKEAEYLHCNHPEDKIIDRYAACVPHVMIYPAMKTIKVQSSKLIELI